MASRSQKIADVDGKDVKEAISRLAHFNPTCRDEYGNQVLDYLVLDALATCGQTRTTALTIREHIKSSFRLEFEEREINISGKRLGERGMITYGEDEVSQNPTFEIMPKTLRKITRNLGKIREVETQVIQEWKQELTGRYGKYPPITANLTEIVHNLQLFMTRMFVRHGVGCVSLLYPGEEKTQRWLESVESRLLEGLPTIDSFCDAVVQLEVPKFFKAPDRKRKAYITGLFNASFFWHLVQVDDKCSKLLRKITQGQKLYLDNNILYSVVGIDGARMLRSVHSMLKMAKIMGYELWVTGKTIDEFHNSLNWRMKELKGKPLVPAEMARIALDNLDEDSFLTVYWRDFVANGTSIEEFVMQKTHLKELLQGLDITVTKRMEDQILRSPKLEEEARILRTVCREDVADRIIEHDAFHRIFVERIRGGRKYRFGEAVAWFLTHDNKLPRYDRVARRGSSCLPFCMTSDQWIQVNRPLLARTANEAEYEESFHVLVTQPFLRTMVSTLSLDEAYNEVLGRLTRYESMTPQLALQVATDTHFMLSMALETDQQSKVEKIESKFVDIASQLQSRAESLQKNAALDKAAIERLEKNIAIHREAIQEIRQKFRAERERLDRELEAEKKSRVSAESLAAEMSKGVRDFRSKVLRWVLFGIALVCTSLALWGHSLWLPWPWFSLHKNIGVMKAGSQLVLLFALLSIPLRRRWGYWVGLAGIFASAVLGAACLQ